MKRLIAGLMLCCLAVISMSAGALEQVSDNELAGISAQGFSMNFQVIDSVVNNSSTFNNNIAGDSYSANTVNINTDSFSMLDSMMISGTAQQNAFAPVNAVNSAVNVPINIVFVLNSQVSGGINITNSLNAALNPF